MEITEGSPGKAPRGPAGELTERATEGRDPSTATPQAHGGARPTPGAAGRASEGAGVLSWKGSKPGSCASSGGGQSWLCRPSSDQLVPSVRWGHAHSSPGPGTSPPSPSSPRPPHCLVSGTLFPPWPGQRAPTGARSTCSCADMTAPEGAVWHRTARLVSAAKGLAPNPLPTAASLCPLLADAC